MSEKNKGQRIVIKTNKKEKNFETVKMKAIFAVLVMVASALIVTGSAWGYGEQATPKYRLAWQIGDVESNPYCSPWDEFGLLKATPYKRNFRVGQDPSFFPRKTAPYCQGYPNQVNILFCTELFTEAIFTFRYSPGYTGFEVIEIYLDGVLLDTFCDTGGFDEFNFCTFKMVEHQIKVLCDPVDEKDHVLTILHKGGDGVFWDYIQLWMKDYSEECPTDEDPCGVSPYHTDCSKCPDSYHSAEKCRSCPTTGCRYFVPGRGFQPLVSNNYYGSKQPHTGYIPPGLGN